MDQRLQKVLMLPIYVRLLLLATILGVIGTGFYFGAYQPQLSKYQKLEKNNAKLKKSLNEKRRYANNLPKYKAEYDQLKIQLDQSIKELPKKKEIPTLLTSIAGLAKKQGLEVLMFKPKKEVAKGFYAEVPVELKLQGAFHQVGMFFDAVGRLDRIVNVGDLDMKRAGKGGAGKLSVTCRAVTFRFVEKPPPPKKGKKKRKKRRR